MGNSASSLPYSIGKQVAFVNDGWALHEGERKSDKAAVTVFLAKKPALAKTPVNPRNPHMAQTACARHHFSNCKRLRHPHILTVLATLDTDHPEEQGASGVGSSPPRSGSGSSAEQGDLIVVTEKCTSLDTWLASQPPPEELAWGLECIVRGLHFLHASAGLCHGNLSPTSFYVTPGGDVKLWNFSLVSAINPQTGGGGSSVPRHFIEWEGLITPAEYRSPERVEGRWDAIGAAGVHAMDSYGLGVLIGCFFSGHVPQVLVKAVQRLQTANLKMRPRLQPLLKCPVFDTPYQKLQLQLEEFTVQPTEYKVQFWNNLTPQLQAGLVTENVAVYKLLPLQKQTIKTICENDTMKTQPQFRQEGTLDGCAVSTGVYASRVLRKVRSHCRTPRPSTNSSFDLAAHVFHCGKLSRRSCRCGAGFVNGTVVSYQRSSDSRDAVAEGAIHVAAL
jgi:SCY1-like protein 1